ncbi:shikimate kinase [Bacillus marinisedimentorum]|uniref:shikimate kinase n=1 Tax=Bacillus marinisedimentorum TaxID=1821260 RepID=UPI00087346DC|nr:shikimate kinase [Bacillus marinisedimentorum]
MKAVFLTGFMGSGKTTIGKVLGEETGLPVIDTDRAIEEKTGKSIPEIFEQEGEESFREYERNILGELPDSDVIVTTGGGMVVQQENRKMMKKSGTVIYLKCGLDEIRRRLEGDQTRPLLADDNAGKLEELFRQRKAFYEEADITVVTEGRPAGEIVKEMLSLIKPL